MNEQEFEDQRAAELLESLEVAADGGDNVDIGDFEASTILAMLRDPAYYQRISDMLA